MNEIFLQIHSQIFDPERIPHAIIAIFMAMIIGVITGPIFGNVFPLTWIGFKALFGAAGDKLGRPDRPAADLIFRGFVLSALALFLALGAGQVLDYAMLDPLFMHMGQAIGLAIMITLGSVWYALLKLYFALEKKDKIVEGAYLAIARSCRANLNAGDDHSIIRLAIGLSLRTFTMGLVAPVFWFLIGGLPATMIYSALAALSWRFKDGAGGSYFARVPVMLEKLMGFAPALYSAFIITGASAITPTATLSEALKAWGGVQGRASYEQGGYPLSVLAWALNLSLGGPYQDLNGAPVKHDWVGPKSASAKIEYIHLRRVLIMSVIIHALFIVSLAGAYMWSAALN